MSQQVYERLSRQQTQQYASKSELLSWVNSLLQLKLSTLQEFQTGAVFCQIIDAFFPEVMPMNKVNYFAFDEFGSLRNFKIFQQSADALQGQSVYLLKDLKADKIIEGHVSLVIEYLQFLYKNLYDKKAPEGYSPKQRRKISLNGGTDKIPITYFQEKEQAFKLGSRLFRDINRDSNLRRSFEKSNSIDKSQDYFALRGTPTKQRTFRKSSFNKSWTPPQSQKSSQINKQQFKTPKPNALPRQKSRQPSKQLKQQQIASSIAESPTTPDEQKDSPFDEQENIEPQNNYEDLSNNKDNYSENIDNSISNKSDLAEKDVSQQNIQNQESNASNNEEFLKSLRENQYLLQDNIPLESLDQALNSIMSACAVVKNTLPKFQQLVEQTGGKMKANQNEEGWSSLLYALKGKIRSMRDVIGTLINHSLELVTDLQNVILKLYDSDKTAELQQQIDSKLKELLQYEEQYLKVCEYLDRHLQDGKQVDTDNKQDAPNVSGLYSSQDQALQPLPLTGFMEEFQQLDQAVQKIVEEQAYIAKYQANDVPNDVLGQLSQKKRDTDKKPLNESATQVPSYTQQSPQKESKSSANVFKFGEYQIRVLRNGDVYKGRYINNVKNGFGVYSFKNGDVYFGEFKGDLMHGVGVYTFADQGRYEGQWSKAVYQSFGMESFAHGSTYHGMYLEGMRHGYGVCRYFNGDYYEGQWQQGQREGKGMQQCTDDSNFVGDYRGGKRHGYGIYTFPNQDQYLGEYQEDIPHGFGVYIFKSGQKYEGQWLNGLKHGWCEYTVETGDVYAGNWDLGKPAWVQSFDGPNEEEEEGLEEKLKKSKEAADQAKLAMDIANDRAMNHWDEKGDMQISIKKYLDESEDLVQEAQKARSEALKIAELLDNQAQSQLSNVK